MKNYYNNIVSVFETFDAAKQKVLEWIEGASGKKFSSADEVLDYLIDLKTVSIQRG